MKERAQVTPCTCFSHDDDSGRLRIDIQIPGVQKKDISLDMRPDSFCVSAPREDTEYSGCFKLNHEVDPQKTEAKYENGLLRIFAPIKGWENRSQIKVQ